MSRRQPKTSSAMKPLGDGTATAESAPVSSTASGSGGSGLAGLVTDTVLINPPKPSFVASPFGQRYLTRRHTGTSVGDVLVRGQMWASSLLPQLDYGTVTTPVLTGSTGVDLLLQDRYVLYREMGKRSLKYKQTPVSLTDYTVWLDMDNADLFLLGNVGTLLNLSRLNHYNSGFGYLTQYLGKYMSRLTRLWRVLSTKPMLGLVKSQGLRNSQIVLIPGEGSGLIRWWSPATLRVTNGPGNIDATLASKGIHEVLQSDALLGKWVEYLETVERWAHMGAPAIITDWLAIRDMIDMVIDVVPGVYTTGLPQVSDMPGISQDYSILTDVFCRMVTFKDDVTAGTDKWSIFPVPNGLYMNGRVPIAGFGQPGVYDHTLLGAPKFGFFDGDATLQISDVNTATRLCGTDLPQLNQLANCAGAVQAAAAFGEDISGAPLDEFIMVEGSGTPIGLGSVINSDGSEDANFMSQHSLKSEHRWVEHRFAARVGIGAGYNRFVEDNDFGYLFFADPQDLVDNHYQYVAVSMGLPYLKAT